MAKLSQQHFRPLLACGYCGCIPSPLSAMTTRKNDENIECLQQKRENAEKAGPSSDVKWPRLSIFFLFTITCFPNSTFPYPNKLGGMP
jgi:hypothetical protein